MTNNFLAIHHVSYIVSNLDDARHFYCQIMGLEEDSLRPVMTFDGIWLNVNEDQQIHLLKVVNPDSKQRPEHGGRDRHGAFRVRDLSVIIARLDQQQIPYTLSKSGRQALFCRDPDGNTLELMEVTT